MKNTLKRMSTMLLCATLLLGLLSLAVTAADTTTVTDSETEMVEQRPYLEKGLVAWYDGGNNANGVHDLQSDLWKDLTGNAHHLDVSDGIDRSTLRWENNSAVVDPEKGLYQRLSYSALQEIVERPYTIEFTFGDLTWEDTATPSLLHSSNDDFSLTASRAEDGSVNLFYQNGKSEDGNPAVQGRVDDLDNTTIALVFTVDDKEETNTLLYADGEKVAEGYTKGFKKLQYVYFGHTAQDKRWGGEIHGVRIYNHALSAEELTANAEADSFNYREGNITKPVERYDPTVDYCVLPVPSIDDVRSNDRIPINDRTDMIPTTGFYASKNLLDYLYPYESEEEPWEGARVMLAEELWQDFSGETVSYVSFLLMYGSVCTRASLKPQSLDRSRYVTLAYKVEGEINGIEVEALSYGEKINDDNRIPATLLNQAPIAGDGTEDTRYLAFDLGDVSALDGSIGYLDVEIDGLEEGEKLYLTEMALFATADEMCAYTGLSPEDIGTETEPETEPAEEKETVDITDDTTEDTTEDTTDGTTDGTTDHNTDITAEVTIDSDESDKRGCTSAVGFGAAAILTAVAAAVALKKPKNE